MLFSYVCESGIVFKSFGMSLHERRALVYFILSEGVSSSVVREPDGILIRKHGKDDGALVNGELALDYRQVVKMGYVGFVRCDNVESDRYVGDLSGVGNRGIRSDDHISLTLDELNQSTLRQLVARVFEGE